MALVWLNALLFQELLAANLDPTDLARYGKGSAIPSLSVDTTPSELVRQWDKILEINWWPIFSTARDTLDDFPTQWAHLALIPLKRAAMSIAARREIRQHDIAGRIYHRLLNSRKFLATNYTTIPAAVVLAGLALDPAHPSMAGLCVGRRQRGWQTPHRRPRVWYRNTSHGRSPGDPSQPSEVHGRGTGIPGYHEGASTRNP